MPKRPLAILTLAVLVSLLALCLRLATVPPLIEHPDGTNFVKGVERYSVPAMSPHFPGYPVFIWLGKLVRLATTDTTRALHLLSIFASTLLLWPTGLVARDFRRAAGGSPADGAASAFLAAGVLALSPLALTLGNQIFADPTALCLAVGMLWCCARAMAGGEHGELWLLAAAVLAGLSPGARLTYVGLTLPFGIALLLAPAPGRRLLGWPPWLLAGLTFMLALCAWLAWQIAQDGWGLLEAARTHVGGHLTVWGGSAVGDPEPLARPQRLAQTLAVSGFGAWWPGLPLHRLLSTLVLLPLVLAGTVRLWRSPTRWPLWLALAWLVPYTVGFLLGHDPGEPRHSLPFVPLLAILAGLGLPTRRWGALAVGLTLTASLASVSVPLAFQHRDTPRLPFKVTRWLRQRPGSERPMLLVTSESRGVVFAAGQTLSDGEWTKVGADLQLAEARRLHGEGRTVYATAPTAESPQEWFPVARLCRGETLDTPQPDELWLLRYEPGGWSGPLPGCS
jgi:hypothetical protein